MVSEKKITEVDNSAVELTVTVGEKEVKTAYDKTVQKYAKTAHIKGFRKGKVPADVLEKKYGDALRQEAAMQIIDESLQEAIESVEAENKPLPYSQPVLQNEDDIDLDTAGSFTFSVTYDVYPKFDVAEYKGFEIEVPQVSVDDDVLDEELKKLQDQNALVVEKNGAAEKDDIVTVDYVELDDDGGEKEDTKREDYVFTIGTGYNLYKFDDDIIGMKADDEKVIEKTYPDDHDVSELAGKTVSLKVKVKAVKKRELPELDDEFAQDVSDKYETLQDLKDDISKRLQNDLQQRLKDYKLNKIIKQIIEKTPFEIPEAMLQAQLEDSWRNFTMRSGLPEEQLLQLLKMQGKSKQEVLEEWKDDALYSIKYTLILNKIIEKEGIEVSDEDLKKYQEEHPDQNVQDADPQRKSYMEYLQKEQIKNDSAADLLIEHAAVKQGEKKSYKEFMENALD